MAGNTVIHTLEEYVEQFKALLPRGKMWQTLGLDVVFSYLLNALMTEFVVADNRIAALTDELDPRTAIELFPEWETFAGLPDPCVGELDTLAQRRAAVLARLTATGGQSRQYFIDLAAVLGFTITISEYDGINPALTTQFHWQVNAALNGDIGEFDMNSDVNTPLRYWGKNELLECMINRLKLAHTIVVFSYT